jgi:hypothetical protein
MRVAVNLLLVGAQPHLLSLLPNLIINAKVPSCVYLVPEYLLAGKSLPWAVQGANVTFSHNLVPRLGFLQSNMYVPLPKSNN